MTPRQDIGGVRFGVAHVRSGVVEGSAPGTDRELDELAGLLLEMLDDRGAPDIERVVVVSATSTFVAQRLDGDRERAIVAVASPDHGVAWVLAAVRTYEASVRSPRG